MRVPVFFWRLDVPYRIYFNAHSDAPLVWSVDDGEGTVEHHVRGFSLLGCWSKSVYTGKPANEDEPVAWIEVDGVLRIEHDFAFFWPTYPPRR